MDALELFAQWGPVRRGLLAALDLLMDEQLQFVPRPGLWSLGTVACHIASAEEGWFRYVVTHELGAWPPDWTSREYDTVAAVKALLGEVHQRTEQFLSPLAANDLDRVVPFPWGGQGTLGWVVWHVLEHEIHHRGEIYLMLGLLGREAPDV